MVECLNEKYYNYERSKKELEKLGINNKEKWANYKKSKKYNKKIPKMPDRYYKDRDWISWADFLSDHNMKDVMKEYYSYEECKKIIHSLNIKTREDLKIWINNNKREIFSMPKKIPSDPYTVYTRLGTWKSFSDFFKINNKKFNYKESKDNIKKYNFKTKIEFLDWTKSSNFENRIPKAPRIYYMRRNEWISWSDFFSQKDLTM
mgnify:CR=1 FL=1